MYMPAHFEETDAVAVQGLIAAFPLATVVVHADHGLVANHFPLLATSADILIGHLAIANDLHRLVADGTDVLAIFQGNDAYISPNWYPSKAVTHKAVPTWNYSTVHLHGKISFQHDEKSKIAAVGRLTQRFERETNGADGWRMADAPTDYMATMLANIVAFKIEVTRVLAKSKLSQNREDADFGGVANALDQNGNKDMAQRMRALRRDT